MNIIKIIAKHVQQLYNDSGRNLRPDDLQKITVATLKGFGIHKDDIEPVRRKLNDGTYVYFTRVIYVEEMYLLDASLEDGYVVDKPHPCEDEFSGRGRKPIDRGEPSDDFGNLNMVIFLKSLQVVPKIQLAAHRDERMTIGFRSKDIRNKLALYGVKVTATQLNNFIVCAAISEVIKPLEGAKVKMYYIDADCTVGQWANSGMSLCGLLEKLENKYIIHAKATG